MRALIVGDGERAERLTAGLQRLGIAVDRAGDPASGGGEISRLAAGILAFERLLGERRPDAVVLEDGSDSALAALIVATKLELPVARLACPEPGADAAGVNRRLLASLADAELADDAEAVAVWVRGT
jgi:hypothetical protein